MKKLFLLTLLLSALGTLFAQSDRKIKGRVIDKDTKETLIGASIVVHNNPNTGTITDVDGNFELTLPNSDAKLTVSYIGYVSAIVMPKNNQTIELVTDALGLDEVVVVGYGTMKKSDMTGSVTSIKSADLNVLSTPNIASALAGRAPGVQVVSSGSVDGAVKVRIRGVGTINNSDPLYVVDGFPTNDISYIAPTDIESMEVLKDASASAIYGSRGANGVIMITTKKGVNQPTKVSANVYVGIRSASKKLDVLNATEYAKARIEANENAGMTMDINERSLLEYAILQNAKGTDWQDEVLRTAIVQNYNVSIMGGSDKSKYNLSVTYNSEDGTLKNSYVDKLFVKFNNEYKFNKYIKFGTDIAYTNYNMSNTDLSNMYGSALTLASRAAPVSPVYDQFGNWQDNMALDNNGVRVNEMERYKKKHGNKFIGNFFLNLDLYKGLSFKSTFGIDYNISKYSDYLPVYFVSQQENNTRSSLAETRYNNLGWVWSNVLNYNWDINPSHRLNAMVGTEATYNSNEMLQATAYDVLENADMRYISAAKSNDYNAASAQDKSTIFSTFLRLNYSYKNKYLLTGTVRSDASSRFSKDNRVGVFPSISAGWNIKEEEFMKTVGFISQLKLRAGWGQVGNQSSAGIGDYLSRISNGLKYVLGGKVYEGRVPTELSNPKLKWEVAEQYNVGLDLGFFDGKLSLNADYFVKNTKDMIVRVPIPDYVGAGEPLDNVGNMRNKGFEFMLSHVNSIGDFSYNVALNMSFIRNEVTSLGRAGSINATVYDQRLSNTSRTEVGREIAYYYGYKTDGIFHTQEELDAYTFTNADGVKQPIQPNAQVGDVKFRDLNRNGKIDEGDLTYLGSYMPDFTGGLNMGVAYKGIDFSLFADFTYGNEIANMTTYDLKSSLVDKNILKSYYENRWTKETPYNSEPRLTTSGAYKENAQFSDRYIEDGSFLRIRNVQLGYTFPEKWMSNLKIDKARIYFSVDNLATFTKYSGYNPEVSDQWSNVLVSGCDVGGTPLPRTFTFGLNVNF